MAIATTDQLREYLDQVERSPAVDEALGRILARAETIITDALGFTFADWDDVAAAYRDVTTDAVASRYLRLPAYQAGSLSSVALLGGKGTAGEEATAITDYAEQSKFYLYRGEGWPASSWVRARAKWGFGPAPASIVELVIELAVNTWRSRDKGSFTEIIGAQGGGAVRYVAGLNSQQRMIIENVRRSYTEAVH